MNIALWVLQVFLGGMFLFAGIQKAFRPLDAIAKMMTWVPHVPPPLVRFIGVAELLGGIGLIAPGLADVLPWLTIWAALGLAVIMALAALFHVSRREYGKAVPNVVFLILAAFVAYGRWRIAPF